MESDNVNIKDTYFQDTDAFDGTFEITKEAATSSAAPLGSGHIIDNQKANVDEKERSEPFKAAREPKEAVPPQQSDIQGGGGGFEEEPESKLAGSPSFKKIRKKMPSEMRRDFLPAKQGSRFSDKKSLHFDARRPSKVLSQTEDRSMELWEKIEKTLAAYKVDGELGQDSSFSPRAHKYLSSGSSASSSWRYIDTNCVERAKSRK